MMQSLTDAPSNRHNSSLWRPLLSLLTAVLLLGFASPALGAVDSYTVGVDGMACPFCAYGIEKKLKALEGVKSIEIHIKEGTVDVQIGEGKDVTPDNLQTAIKEAGFEIRDLHLRGEAEIENQNGAATARFTDAFSLPVVGAVSKTGEQSVEGTIVQEKGKWRLKIEANDGGK